MSNVKISDLPASSGISSSDLIEISEPSSGSNPYESKSATLGDLGTWVGNTENFSQLATTAKTLVGAINEIAAQGGDFYDLIPDGDGPHNSFFRGRDLGNIANINWATIQQGKFHDMFVGDYWTYHDTPTNQDIIFRIAGFDVGYDIGSPQTLTRHIAIIPDTTIVPGPVAMNDGTSGSNARGSYIKSGMRGYKTAKETFIPSDFTLVDSSYQTSLAHKSAFECYFAIDGVLSSVSHNIYNGKLSFGYGEPLPSGSEFTIHYKYLDDSNIQTITETFDYDDYVEISGNTRYYFLQYGRNNPVKVSASIDGVDYPDHTNCYVSSDRLQVNTRDLVDPHTITFTYTYQQVDYGGIANARAIIERAFGHNHILEHGWATSYEYDGNNGGRYGSVNFYLTDIEIPTEQQINGNRTIGIQNNFGNSDPYASGSRENNETDSDNVQLPLFALCPNLKCNRQAYWLRNRALSTPVSNPPIKAEFDNFQTGFIGMTAQGVVEFAGLDGAAISNLGVRPVFYIAHTRNYNSPAPAEE